MAKFQVLCQTGAEEVRSVGADIGASPQIFGKKCKKTKGREDENGGEQGGWMAGAGDRKRTGSQRVLVPLPEFRDLQSSAAMTKGELEHRRQIPS